MSNSQYELRGVPGVPKQLTDEEIEDVKDRVVRGEVTVSEVDG